VPNRRICSSVELQFHGGVGGAELEKTEQGSPKSARFSTLSRYADGPRVAHKRSQSGATVSGAEAEKSAAEASDLPRDSHSAAAAGPRGLRGSSICPRGRLYGSLTCALERPHRKTNSTGGAVGDKSGRQWSGIGLGNETCAATAGHEVELVGLQSSAVHSHAATPRPELLPFLHLVVATPTSGVPLHVYLMRRRWRRGVELKWNRKECGAHKEWREFRGFAWRWRGNEGPH